MSLHNRHQKKVMLSVWWDFKGIVYFELLSRNQTINSNVYYRQLMKLDKEMKEKRPELATRKGDIFHQDNARHQLVHIHLWSLAKNYWSWDWKWCLIHRIVLTLHHPIIIYSVHFKTIWMKKHSILMTLSKMSWFSFLPIRTKLSTKVELWSWLEDGKRSSHKIVNT